MFAHDHSLVRQPNRTLLVLYATFFGEIVGGFVDYIMHTTYLDRAQERRRHERQERNAQDRAQAAEEAALQARVDTVEAKAHADAERRLNDFLVRQ